MAYLGNFCRTMRRNCRWGEGDAIKTCRRLIPSARVRHIPRHAPAKELRLARALLDERQHNIAMEPSMPLMVDSPTVLSPRAVRGHSVEHRADNIVALKVPREADRQVVLDWAMATVAQAEQRLAALQARIEYLEGLSVTDELTGLLNRRGFLAQLERAIASARRGGPHGVLMICDLDGFKAINDRHGHLVGDDALCQTAELLAQHIRRADTVARLGGDEFAVLLVGAHLVAARRKAQALAQLVAATSVTVGTCQFSLRVSFGLAAYSGEESEEELLNRADMAMYGQKRRHAAARAIRV
jgi:diguanylate cyclase (GGDEF)-like protein